MAPCSRSSRERFATRTTFSEVSPAVTSQEVVAGPAVGGTESPAGWLFAGNQRSVDIAGNNVRAYLDTDANDEADTGGTTVGNGSFLTPADLSIAPSVAANKNVAAQNLFYLNNLIHDELYRHGFTEAAGNFQENNFGRGGRGKRFGERRSAGRRRDRQRELRDATRRLRTRACRCSCGRARVARTASS